MRRVARERVILRLNTTSKTYRGTSNTCKNISTLVTSTPILPTHAEAYAASIAAIQPTAKTKS